MAVGQSPPSDSSDALAAVYTEVCANHRAIADFRAKLLALLPTVSGAAIFVLLARDGTDDGLPLAAIGLFGFAVTFGLFMYDLRGIQDCIELRRRSTEIEAELKIKREDLSLFRGWPTPRLLRLADEVGAGWIIYTAVLFSWLYLAGHGSIWKGDRGLLLVLLYVLLLIAFIVWIGRRIRGPDQEPREGTTGARTWEHSALTVADLKAAVAFYEQAFGYEVRPDDQELSREMASLVGVPSLECDLAQLDSPVSKHVLELVQFRNLPDGDKELSPTRPGSGHLSFVVADIDAALAAVKSLDGTAVGEITQFPDGGRRVYCRDPSGTTTIELAEPLSN